MGGQNINRKDHWTLSARTLTGRAGNAIHPVQNLSLTGAGQDSIRTRASTCVIRAERGIDTTQRHRYIGPAGLDTSNHLKRARIPIGHHGSDENSIRVGLDIELFLENLGWQAVSSPAARNVGQGFGFSHLRLGETPTAVRVTLGTGSRRTGMAAVEAVNQSHIVPCLTQHRSHGQEAEGLDPQVVGREVIDPGVDAENSCHKPRSTIESFL